MVLAGRYRVFFLFVWELILTFMMGYPLKAFISTIFMTESDLERLLSKSPNTNLTTTNTHQDVREWE